MFGILFINNFFDVNIIKNKNNSTTDSEKFSIEIVEIFYFHDIFCEFIKSS